MQFFRYMLPASLIISALLSGCTSTPGREKPLDPVMAMAVTPDGRKIGVSTSTHEVACFDVEPLRFQALFTPEGVKRKVKFHTALRSPPVAFSKDGKVLIAAGIGGNVVGWDIESGLKIFSSPADPEVLDIAVFPNKPAFMTAGPGLKMLDSETGQLIATFNLPDGVTASSVCLSSDGKGILVGCSDGNIAVYDADSREFMHKWTGHQVAVTGLALSPDGDSLASNAGLYDLRLWEIDNNLQPAISAENIDILSAGEQAKGDGTQTVSVLAWLLGTASGYQITGAPTLAFPSSVFQDAATSSSPYGVRVVFSPDGRYLAASSHMPMLSGDFQVFLIDLNNMQIRMLKGIYGCSVAFTRDSKILLTGGLSAPTLWDVATGEKLTSQ